MGKMNFGFTAVQAGQKSSTVNAEPRLIANSTPGKFMITSPVSKALGVAVGENIQFLNNIICHIRILFSYIIIKLLAPLVNLFVIFHLK